MSRLFARIKSLVHALCHPWQAARYILGNRDSTFSLGEIEDLIGSPSWIIEAGACDGSDSRRFLLRWPEVQVLACEPVPELFSVAESQLREFGSRVHLRQVALGPAGQRFAEMYVGNEIHDSASILEPTLHIGFFPEVTFDARVRVRVTTLDVVWKEIGRPDIDLLWLDLQGFELSALSGGLQALQAVKAAIIEVSMVRLYKGAPVVGEVDRFMRDHGFQCSSRRIPLVAGNAIYLRTQV